MELTILTNLIHDGVYADAVIPYLKEEYFSEETKNRHVFGMIKKHIDAYKKPPSVDALLVELEDESLLEKPHKQVKEILQGLRDRQVNEGDSQWLLDKTEKFCQNQAIILALRKSIALLDDTDKKTEKTVIPSILSEALAISFDSRIGHNFIDDAESRYEMYHSIEDRIGFDINILNDITGGGFPKKTLNCFIGPPGSGKTLHMCHHAAYNLSDNKNVLYITLEMAEERIAQRIDQNLMGITDEQLMRLTKTEYDKRISRVRETTKGKLIIKEYPTSTAGALHFKHLINELRTKKGFVPDIIYIDYLNLCVSSRIKLGSSGVTSYTYIKAIAEELRGLAVENDLPIVTATQSNRDTVGSSDFGMENTSESLGLPMTVDFMLAIISTDELDTLGQAMYKQLKNRYGDLNKPRFFIVGVDKSKMKLYNVENSAQDDLLEGPVMDQGAIMEREDESKSFGKSKFEGFH